MEIIPASIRQSFYGISATRPADGRLPAGSARESGFPGGGEAYVRRGASSGGGFEGLYGPDGRIRSSGSTAASSGAESDEEKAAEERTLGKLEARDRQVRQKAENQESAAGDVNFIYQTGPDGQQYAIGSMPHTVEQKNGRTVSQEENFADATGPVGPDGKDLSKGDRQLVEDLKARDAKVRQHEAAHIMAAGGQASSAPTYVYQTGPDGRRYAVGGSVQISMGSSTGDPEEAERTARKAHRAAMATGEPSAADLNTAQRAMSLAARASRRGLAEYARYALTPQGDSGGSGGESEAA